jgi:xylulokinase
MSKELLLGVDVGTTRLKAAAFDLQGQLVASSLASYPLRTDTGINAAEQDPMDWWSAATRAISSVMEEVSSAQILALSVGGQGPTVVTLDKDLNPLCPALTWMDLRATREAKLLNEKAGRHLPPHYFMPKALWLKENWPQAYANTQAFCQAWDFVASRLLDELIVSTSPGLVPWSDELIAAAGLEPAKFPNQHKMGELLGRVTARASRACGLPEGLPVIGGISDFFEGLIGSGTFSRGQACDNGGTSQGFSVCWDAPLASKALLNIPSFIDGQWYVGGPVSTTGKALDWWLESILGCEPGDYSALAGMTSTPLEGERLIFLPYLAGERAPIWNPKARGVFFGLSINHQHEHLTRAVLEAVAYTLCHLISYICDAGGEVSVITTCGGQARNEAWCQIKADITGCRVVLPEVTDTPILGAAIIAGVGLGLFDNYAVARKMIRTRAILEPQEEFHAQYQHMFRIYQDLYNQILPLYDRLNSQ